MGNASPSSSPSPSSSSKELRVLILATLGVLALTVAGLFWARHVLGDGVRAALAATDVRSLSDAAVRYESANRDAVRARLRPGGDWRALSRAEGDWLIAQLAAALQLNDDSRDRSELNVLVDPWHRPYHAEARQDGDTIRFRFRSLGSDGKPDTADDVTSPEPAPPATGSAT